LSGAQGGARGVLINRNLYRPAQAASYKQQKAKRKEHSGLEKRCSWWYKQKDMVVYAFSRQTMFNYLDPFSLCNARGLEAVASHNGTF
jgi:hypothetical protein